MIAPPLGAQVTGGGVLCVTGTHNTKLGSLSVIQKSIVTGKFIFVIAVYVYPRFKCTFMYFAEF